MTLTGAHYLSKDVMSTSFVFVKPGLKCKPDIALFAVEISISVYKNAFEMKILNNILVYH